MRVPKHLAIIMDGNGRWAQAQHRPRIYGHIKGARIAKKIITACSRKNIQHLTLYAFSTENWYRPEAEVQFLMRLLGRYLLKETDNLIKENIRFSTIGDIQRLPRDIVTLIQIAQNKTQNCTGLHVTFALSYGSRSEITSAVQIISQKILDGKIKPEDITESLVHSHLTTAHQPDPDLIIRTSGEQRLSNFLLWQSAYSEFYFTDILWPDFTERDLDIALNDYQSRSRRYGALEIQNEELSH